MEGPGELVVAHLPRFGERRTHFEVFVRFDERVIDVLQDLKREVGACLVGVELVRLTGDGRDEVLSGLIAEVNAFTG
jgi:hypothetical protein